MVSAAALAVVGAEHGALHVDGEAIIGETLAAVGACGAGGSAAGVGESAEALGGVVDGLYGVADAYAVGALEVGGAGGGERSFADL